MTDSIYGSITETKTNSFIPLLKNGKSIESKYNPEREAETLIQQLDKDYNFYVICGVGSGILVNLISEKNPLANCICVENNQDDINFLSQLDSFKKLLSNSKITVCTVNELKQNLIQKYLPAVYGDIKIIFQKIWAQENNTIYENARNEIENAIKQISSDYSVQAHFGKIWQKNILTNLKLYSKKTNKSNLNFDTTKTAAVIAAGPSLDETVHLIKNNRDKYYLISTDTAYQSLLKHNLIPEVVVSIDGQLVSGNHFFNTISSNTNFIFDLCGNFSASNKLAEKNNIYFFTNGHPLSNLAAEQSNNSIPSVFTGAGTVTIAAIDIAIKTGFNNIELFGADFGYINNKPYTKGTYLDSLYNLESNLTSTIEKQFSKLMFRTELYRVSEQKKTTSVLVSYKESLEKYLTDSDVKFTESNNIYKITNNCRKSISFTSGKFNFMDFISVLNKENYYPFLPYIAYLRLKKSNRDNSFETLLNLAYKDIVSYN